MKTHLPGLTQVELRNNPAEFRHTVELYFGSAANTLYITSHDNADYPSGAVFIRRALVGVSGSSQSWDFYNGFSTIGDLAVRFLDPDPLNLVSNGAFDSSTGWTFGGNWSYNATDDRADKTSGGGTDDLFTTSALAVTVGRWYRVTYEQGGSDAGGTRLAQDDGAFRNAPASFATGNGWKSYIVDCTHVDELRIEGDNDFNGWLDNVTVAELTVSQWLAHQRFDQGNGIRGKRVAHYIGLSDQAWTAFEIPSYTYFIEAASRLSDGALQLRAGDAKRFLKQKILQRDVTTLRESITAVQSTVRVYNLDTTNFARVEHDASYSDAPSATVGYIEIGKDDNLEIIRFTGLVTQGGFTEFTGCVRGRFGTVSQPHNVDSGVTEPARQPKVTQYHYLQGPTINIIHQLLTGESLVTSPVIDDLPAALHCGVDPAFVDTASFTGIGDDLYNATTPADSVESTLERLKERSGKQLIEKLLHRVGCRLRINKDGQLQLRRIASVLGNNSYVMKLNPQNCKSWGQVRYEADKVLNALAIQWNYNPLIEQYATTSIFGNTDSINAHGISDLRAIKLRDVRASRSTARELAGYYRLHNERYADEPLSLDVQGMPATMMLEEGDIVEVNLPMVKDMRNPDGQGIDLRRTMEVQKISENWIDGGTSLRLFGSSVRAIRSDEQLAQNAIPDAAYDRSGVGGTELDTPWTISSNVVTAGATLTGAADAYDAQFYWLNNLTIDDNCAWTDNVMIWVRGFLTIQAPFTAIGEGMAGGASVSTLETEGSGFYRRISNPGPAGVSGIGNCTATSGIVFGNFVNGAGRYAVGMNPSGNVTIGNTPATPPLQVVIEGNNLVGLPRDLRGSGGPAGSGAIEKNSLFGGTVTLRSQGGNGGAGGGGIIIICRGLLIDVNAGGSINTSGDPGAQPAAAFDDGGGYFYRGGSGGGGSPGGVAVVLDGNVSIPSWTGLICNQGECPTPSGATHLPSNIVYGGGLNSPELPAGTWTTGEYDTDVAAVYPTVGNYNALFDRLQNLRDSRLAFAYVQPAETAEDEASERRTIATPSPPSVTKVGEPRLNPDGTLIGITMLATANAVAFDPAIQGFAFQARRIGTGWRNIGQTRGTTDREIEFFAFEGEEWEVRYMIVADERIANSSSYSTSFQFIVSVGERAIFKQFDRIESSNVNFGPCDCNLQGNVVAAGRTNVDDVGAWIKDPSFTSLGSSIAGGANEVDHGNQVRVSADGQTIAIADRQNTAGGTDAGAVRIWRWDTTTDDWAGPTTLQGANAGDFFGTSIDMSKDPALNGKEWLVVGAPGYNNGAEGDGRVYFYERTAVSTWTARGTVTGGVAGADRTGEQVCMSRNSDVVAIATPLDDRGSPTVTNCGRIAIYRKNAPGTGYTFVDTIDTDNFDNVNTYAEALNTDARLGTSYGTMRSVMSMNYDGSRFAFATNGGVAGTQYVDDPTLADGTPPPWTYGGDWGHLNPGATKTATTQVSNLDGTFTAALDSSKGNRDMYYKVRVVTNSHTAGTLVLATDFGAFQGGETLPPITVDDVGGATWIVRCTNETTTFRLIADQDFVGQVTLVHCHVEAHSTANRSCVFVFEESGANNWIPVFAATECENYFIPMRQHAGFPPIGTCKFSPDGERLLCGFNASTSSPRAYLLKRCDDARWVFEQEILPNNREGDADDEVGSSLAYGTTHAFVAAQPNDSPGASIYIQEVTSVFDAS